MEQGITRFPQDFVWQVRLLNKIRVRIDSQGESDAKGLYKNQPGNGKPARVANAAEGQGIGQPPLPRIPLIPPASARGGATGGEGVYLGRGRPGIM